MTSLKPSRSRIAIVVGRSPSSQHTSERIRQRQAIGEAGELIEMRELAQLLFGPLAGGDVLVHEGDAAQCAVLAEQRRGRDADIDVAAILAQPPGFDAANDLTAAGAPMHRRCRILLVRGNHRDRAAEHFRFAVAVDVLGGAVPHEQLAIEIRAGDRDRRRIDDGVERILRLAQQVGLLEPLIALPLQRTSHLIESIRELAEFTGRGNRGAMAQFSRRQDRRIALELAQRPNDAARQHPRNDRSEGDGAETEQSAPFELGRHRCGGDLHRHADGHQPGCAVCGRIAGDAGDIVVPGRNLPPLPGAQPPGRIVGFRKVASDPIGHLRERCDRDPSIADDPDDAAGRKLAHSHRAPERLDQSPDDQHPLQLARRIPDRAGDGENPATVCPGAEGTANRNRLIGLDLMEECTVANGISSAECGADDFAVRPRHEDIGDEARQFRLQPAQQRVVRRRVGGIGGDDAAEAEHEVFQIADMIVELGGENAGFG